MLNEDFRAEGIGPGLASAVVLRLRATLRSRIALAILVGVTAGAVVAEPFGTFGILPLLPRILYWSVIVGASILAGAAFDEIARRIIGPNRFPRAEMAAAAMMTLAYSPFVFLWSSGFARLGLPLQPSLPRIFVSVLVPTVTVYAVIHLVRPYLGTSRQTPAASRGIAQPRLVRRLTGAVTTIHRLSASDHLTDVATDRGVERIRIRFADAVHEMEPTPGCCIHRSHWVALAAVKGLARRDGKLFVRLVNGEELPVSRTYRPRLEAALPELF